MIGVYAITNIEISPERIYFGQSINIKKRLYEHLWALKRNVHENPHLQHSFNKYGEQSFIFAPFRAISNTENLTQLEKQAITEAKELGMEVYNITDPETPPFLGRKHSAESKLKMSSSKKGKNLGNKSRTGQKRSQAEKDKTSKANSKSGNPNFGKTASVETRKKMSIKRKQYWKNKNSNISIKEI